ncbi:pyrimidine reductase family protein [Actinopolyspora erythraea]|uniref:5-amino-6-(5-phosphoribosylamino)uracil reductase n=1 Tax=Actinopolyspora erythraea TaxID=414996 RepID=A0A099D4Z8_9ACTN|nr:pyrimidine reductase family protein [Actinopolyspora erythraea]ASU79475.1 pyrimidine reductase family protein [Actinopolyspora erythraea]KGI80897.1 5-amino-6-(5-phosphoribosylamino)uracil reductase [Actinopolyspora erythraea]
MYQLWPLPGTKQVDSGPETAEELERFYEYPATLTRPWLRVNFVSSLDGSAAVDGGSRGLSSPADRRVLSLVRDLSDVVLVGAGTAAAEGYRGLRRTETRTRRRAERGLGEVPPVAVVTGSGSVDPESPLVTDTIVPPIVLTSEAAPADRLAALSAAGAEVVTTGRTEVDLPTALRELARRGLYRVGCEGGPGLFGSLIAADLVDELCLTMSPLLTGDNSSRIATGPVTRTPRGMRLLSALYADESMLLLRYGRLAE